MLTTERVSHVPQSRPLELRAHAALMDWRLAMMLVMTISLTACGGQPALPMTSQPESGASDCPTWMMRATLFWSSVMFRLEHGQNVPGAIEGAITYDQELLAAAACPPKVKD